MEEQPEAKPRQWFGAKRYVRRSSRMVWPFLPFGLAPLAGLLFLVLFGFLPFANGWIERATLRTAERALADIDADWVTPSVSGQWVTLRGAPPSKQAAEEVVAAVQAKKARTLFGFYASPITRVRARFDADNSSLTQDAPSRADVAADNKPEPGLTEEAPPELELQSPDWQFSLEESVLTLSGEVSNDAMRAAIVKAAESVIDPPRINTVRDETVINTARADSMELIDTALRGVSSLGGCIKGVAAFENDIFSLRCQAPAAAIVSLRALASAPLSAGTVGTIELLADAPLAQDVNEARITVCEETLERLLSASKIEFASESARIGTSSNALLDEIAEAAADCPGVLRIKGHTDNIGEVTYNINLSQQRADAVRTALIERGVSQERLIAEGLGPNAPIADNRTRAGRAQNRRIEIKAVREEE